MCHESARSQIPPVHSARLTCGLVSLKSASRNHSDRFTECFPTISVIKASRLPIVSIRTIIRDPPRHIPYYLAQTMRFSFLLAVVAALTTSMSASAQCADLNGVCGSSSAVGDKCCPGLTCTTDFRLSQVLPLTLSPNELGKLSMWQHRSVYILLYEFPGCLEQTLDNIRKLTHKFCGIDKRCSCYSTCVRFSMNA
ncbi:hypothetical protein EDB19DRAFT_148409 [Suillus lakei]|nr:hypothetical protein EDB19DRAFT_148409 [Suillus lakei]